MRKEWLLSTTIINLIAKKNKDFVQSGYSLHNYKPDTYLVKVSTVEYNVVE